MSQTPFIPSGAHAPADQPDLLGAVNDFILAFCLPALPQERLYRAHQNHISPPKAGEQADDYAVMQHVGGERHGTNVRRFIPGNDGSEDLTIHYKLSVEEVQVDFYGPHALARAQALAMLSWSMEGVSFFNQYGLSSCYANDPVNNTGLGGPGSGDNRFVPRYTVRAFFSVTTSQGVRQPGFDRATLTHVENVNVHHPVKE